MPAAQPRRHGASTVDPATRPEVRAEPSRNAAAASQPAKLADERAIPAPSPVHQLQAELLQLTAPEQSIAEPLYPGWVRVAFPLVGSAVLWAAILWGAIHLA